jgi:hypothetical protein
MVDIGEYGSDERGWYCQQSGSQDFRGDYTAQERLLIAANIIRWLNKPY